MCRGRRVPICWPVDGLQHEKGSGVALADVYRRLGAPMLPKPAENRGGGHFVEPAIEEMLGYMKRGAFTIASHMTELGEELLNYHRQEDYKIVKLRDDLISAVRYAFMGRHHGKAWDHCDDYGRAPGAGSPDAFDPRPRPRQQGASQIQVARDMDWDPFTGR
jgi:hypothetical protein